MSYTQVISKLLDKATKNDIGFVVKLIAIGVFFVMLGITISLIMYGSVEIDVQSKPKSVESAK